MLSSLVRRLKNIFLLDDEVKLEKKKNSVSAQRNLLVWTDTRLTLCLGESNGLSSC